MRFTAIIFDLDGTLLDTLDDIAFSMNAALAGMDAPTHPTSAYRRFVGQGLDTLARLVLPDARRDEATVKECVAAMRKVYDKRWAHATRPYEGIADMLAALKQAGIRCAVCSNKAHDFTVKMVSHFFGDGAFAMVVGGGKFQSKPDPEGVLHIAKTLAVAPENIMYVGDSDVDMMTAVSAGMYPVGVAWGFRSKEELIENGAKVIVERPGEIVRMIDRK